jgi:CRP-like cAMP-binding protein
MTAIFYAHFKKAVEAYSPVPETEMQRFAKAMQEKRVQKDEMLLKEGQVCRDFYFIVKGCLRKFSTENGADVNVQFYFEDEFACDFSSYRYEVPSTYFIEAVENTIVYCGNKAEIKPLLDNDVFYPFAFRFFQEHYFQEEEHANQFKQLSPEQRYQFLIDNKPHYLQRIPLTLLASYLGVSRETLSRIRRKMR